jgi:ankyrin repeat protein
MDTKGCDVNAQDDDKDTPIHNALYFFDPRRGGDINVLTYLLNQMGVDPNIKGQFGYTLLHMACKYINYLPLHVFKVLIENGGCDVNEQANNNYTPVHLAFRAFNPRHGGDITVLAYLINQNNVNLNIKNEKGCNLLHYACINNLSLLWNSAELNAECDDVFYQMVEFIAEKCVQQVLDETTP